MHLKTLIRRCANSLGIDIIRFHNSPKRTLLGLAGVDFGSVIDCGANEGQFARMVSRFFPKAELYCFEPLERPYRKLTAWADKQNGRVKCFNLALGDHEDVVEMHLHREHTPSSSLLAATGQCHQLYPKTCAESIVKVRLSTLDTALEGHLDHMPREIFLKLDVQGFEDRVLRGGGRVLQVCKAVLLEISLAPLYKGQAEFYGLAQLLHEAGFLYAGNLDQTYGEGGQTIFLDALFVRN